MENGSKKMEEIKEIFWEAPKMGATHLVNKKLGGDR